jgi:hypothetical protein
LSGSEVKINDVVDWIVGRHSFPLEGGRANKKGFCRDSLLQMSFITSHSRVSTSAGGDLMGTGGSGASRADGVPSGGAPNLGPLSLARECARNCCF